MTSTQNQALKALPNVLHDQTVPNTLGGISPPQTAARRRLPMNALAVGAGVALALLIALLTRT